MRILRPLSRPFICLLCASLAALAAAPGAKPTPHAALPFPVAKSVRFRSIGPAVSGGRVTAVAGVGGNPRIYYVGAADGGIFRSRDGGVTWKAEFQHQPVASIGALAVDPKNPGIVWAGTGEANVRNDVSYGDGVYKSTDAGRHWQRMGLQGTFQISRIVINPLDPDTVYVAAMGEPWANNPQRGVFKTTDGGKSWRKVLYLGPGIGISDLAINPKNPQILYAAGYRFRRTPWHYSDGGAADAIYKTRDGGRHWRRLTGHGLPGGAMGRIGLAVAPSRPRVVYAVMGSHAGVVWRSGDGGRNWKLVSSDDEVDARPFYFSHLAVSPRDPNRVFALSMYLMESSDGGRHFHAIAKQDHVDNHAIWISPGGRRILEGNDGGAMLSRDGGRTWSFLDRFAIGQFYHIAVNNQAPYSVCGGLQDNSSWCGLAHSPDPQGILNRSWFALNGGDGIFAVPQPGHPNHFFESTQNGTFYRYNRRTRQIHDLDPYPRDFSGGGVARLPYRFDWDAGFAVSPFNPQTVYFGANVVFRSTEDGINPVPISPDLTRNDKSKQGPSGGPVIQDNSGAEVYDTILSIAPSPRNRQVIWVGTDDGLVWVTRDGGKHWNNVTAAIPNLPSWGRVDCVDASPESAASAVIAVDRHFSGDLRPYLYRTTNYGQTWQSISGNLPPGFYAHVVRQDPVNPHLFYAGVENGLYASWDAGRRWFRMGLGLPHAAVWDIQIEHRDDDLVVGTHGRSIWVLDDLRPFQQYHPGQTPAALHLYRVRPVRRYWPWSTVENLGNGAFYGKNPPYGALLSYYVPRGTATAGQLVIRNARHQIVRTYKGLKPAPAGQKTAAVVPARKPARPRLHTHAMKPAKVAVIPAAAGLQRVSWNLRSQPPAAWHQGLKSNNPKNGALVPPGIYTATLTVNGQSVTRTIHVYNDPRVHVPAAAMNAQYAMAHRLFHEISMLDKGLNRLDALRAQVAALETATRGGPQQAYVRQASRKLLAAARKLQNSITSNPRAVEDTIRYPDRIREHLFALEGFLENWDGAPTQPEIREMRRYDREYQAARQRLRQFFQAAVASYNRGLAAHHLPGVVDTAAK